MSKETGTYQAFGKNLKKLREDMGITQNQLADITGIARRTIQDYEQGIHKEPTASIVFLLAGFFRVDPVQLMTSGTIFDNNVFHSVVLEELKQINSTEKINEIHSMENNGKNNNITDELTSAVQKVWNTPSVGGNYTKPYIRDTVIKYMQHRNQLINKYSLIDGLKLIKSQS